MAVKHGGNLLEVAIRYGSDPADWIDLSTGVSPFTYPVKEIPQAVWNQLPQDNDGLEQAAAKYYKAPSDPIAVAGSQAAIMLLPEVITEKLGRCGVIALPKVGYKEHRHAWSNYWKNGCQWQLEYYEDKPDNALVERCDVVLVINPNNPTAKLNRRNELLEIYTSLSKRNATLIVDEAFIDCTPEESILDVDKDMDNLVVLRSVGKFFGLAGARVGFVFARSEIKKAISNLIGPWTVTGPSRWLVKQALTDIDWHSTTKVRIHDSAQRLSRLIAQWLSVNISGTDLFVTAYLDDAQFCHDFLCRQKVLTRLCDEKNALRLGLPANENQWGQITAALTKLSETRSKSSQNKGDVC